MNVAKAKIETMLEKLPATIDMESLYQVAVKH